LSHIWGSVSTTSMSMSTGPVQVNIFILLFL
jgi:hypothetical protein